MNKRSLQPTRRGLLGGATALAAASTIAKPTSARGAASGPLMVGSPNALPGMKQAWDRLAAGADPLDVAIEVVRVVEADPTDTSVGLGGLPNEDGVVQLDAACMHGPTHNSGAVAAIENILHPSEVARLVMERTDHCLIVGRGAYEFARMHGHEHVELLTEESRKKWLSWKERLSDRDDYLPPRGDDDQERDGGTIHCSALSRDGHVGCTTTTSGLSYKVPGRVGDSPIIGAGLYCDDGVGSAGATGRGEAAVLSNGSFAIVELMRQGASPLDAGLEVLSRIAEQARRASSWQPALVNERGEPSFNIAFYILDLDGRQAGVRMRGAQAEYALADSDGARLERATPLFES